MASVDGGPSPSDGAGSPLDSAIRNHESGEWKERFEFFPREAPTMLGSLLLPMGGARAAVLVCSSLKTDRVGWRQRERSFAQLLVQAGFAVLRFDYRGEGQSHPAEHRPSFDDLVADVADATNYLRQAAAAPVVGLVGIRFGALVALACHLDKPMAVVAWEPVPSGEEFFHGLAKTKVIQEMGFERDAVDDDQPTLLDQVAADVFADEMARFGAVDVCGFSVERSLFETSVGRRFETEARREARPLLIAWSDEESHKAGDWVNRDWLPQLGVEVATLPAEDLPAALVKWIKEAT